MSPRTYLAAFLVASSGIAHAQFTVTFQPHGPVSALGAGPKGYEAPPDTPPAVPFQGNSESFGPDLRPPWSHRRSEFEVLHYNGEFVLEACDLVIPGRGLDFVWARKYRSRQGPNTAMGKGWDFSYNLRIEASGSNVLLFDGNSRKDAYLLQPGNIYTAKKFFREGVFNPDGTFTLRFENNGVWNFHKLDGAATHGKIQSIADRHGNTLAFSYDGLGRLTSVLDTLGRAIAIGYNADNRIETVTDFAGRELRYAYYQSGDAGGGAGDLKSFRTPLVTGTPNANDFPLGKTTTYAYSKGFTDDRLNHNLLSVTDALGRTFLTNTYAPTTNPRTIPFDRVITQIHGDPGDRIDYSYISTYPIPFGQTQAPILRAIVNDRMGHVKEYFYDSANRLVKQREFTGLADPDQPTTATTNRPVNPLRPDDPAYFETLYEHNEDALTTKIVHPNGNITQNVYELALNPTAPWRTRRNLRECHRTPGTHTPPGDQASIDEFWEYEPGFGGAPFATKHTDARGNDTIHSYDAAGNRTQTQHRIPTILEKWEYNGFGQVTAHEHPDNGSGWLQRDEFAYYTPVDGPQNGYRKNQVLDKNAFALTTTYEYDAVGNLLRRIDPKGNDTLFTVNALNQVVRETSREIAPGLRYDNEVWYDGVDQNSRVEIENWDDMGVLQPNARWTTLFEYDILGELTKRTVERDPSYNVVTEFEYDDNRNLSLIRQGEAVNGNDPLNTLHKLYDERDLLFREIRAQGSPDVSTTQYDYDRNGNPKALREALEDQPRMTLYAYDGYDRRVNQVDPMGNVIEHRYDPNGNLGGDQATGVPHLFGMRTLGELVDIPGSAANIRLAEEMYRYDAMDRRLAVESAHFDPATQLPILDGLAITTTSYTDASKTKLVTDDNGDATLYEYDTANRLLRTTDPKGNSITNTYDDNSNLTRTDELDLSDLGNPPVHYFTDYAYDGLDRKVGATDNAGNPYFKGLDSRGNTLVTFDPRGNIVRAAFDGLSRIISKTSIMTDNGTGGGVIVDIHDLSLIWDDSSRLKTEIDDNGHATNYLYDSLDRRVGTLFADGTLTDIQIDAHGNALQTTDRNGSMVTNSYDLNDRFMGCAVIPGPGVALDTTFEIVQYDGLSRVNLLENNGSQVTSAYDSLSNKLLETQKRQPGGPPRLVAMSYDGEGNLFRLAYPGGRALLHAYDALDRVDTVSDDPGPLVAAYDYAGPLRVERRDFGNGTRFETSYDGVRRMTNAHHERIAGGTVIEEQFIGWDPASNRAALNTPLWVPPQNQIYAYDSSNRLVRSDTMPGGTTIQYLLDGVGNRNSVVGGPQAGPYTMDATLPEPADFQANQYTTTPFDARTYDRNGNLTQKGPPAILFSYDFKDRLVSVVNTGSGVTTTYAYDGMDRRIEKIVGGAVTRFYYHESRAIEEQNAGDATTATYAWGEGPLEILQMKRGATTSFLHADDAESVVLATDAAGNASERYRYGDFGKPGFFNAAFNPIPNSNLGNPHLFQASRFDPETGFNYQNERYADTSAGTYIDNAEGSDTLCGGAGDDEIVYDQDNEENSNWITNPHGKNICLLSSGAGGCSNQSCPDRCQYSKGSHDPPFGKKWEYEFCICTWIGVWLQGIKDKDVLKEYYEASRKADEAEKKKKAEEEAKKKQQEQQKSGSGGKK